ncbi:unnamed protein product, partial [Chrysoparadoxa australica]
GKSSAAEVDAAKESFLIGLGSGAVAGTTVDLILFPLDTVKTRLQATAGAKFSLKIFKGIFDGVVPAIAASAPCAAVFFGAYDSLKTLLGEKTDEKWAPFVHSAAAAGADLTQSIVRVPFEVVKQRLQAGVDPTTLKAVSGVFKSQGLWGFYTGWGALALRDLPFDIIEFPMYEFFKQVSAAFLLGVFVCAPLAPWEGSLCGSVAGGIAAALTTPLDVVKTRLMTQDAGTYKGILDAIATISKQEGIGALYAAGMVPRATSIAFGGAIFFGAYETAKTKLAERSLARQQAATK